MLSQRALEAFQAVMTTGRVSAAAEELNVSQPAVSRLIRDLEEQTQLRLFTRHGGRIVATREAHEFMAEVERSFRGLRMIERAATEIRRGRRGTVSVASMPALAQAIMPDVLVRVGVQRPDFNIELLTMPTLGVIRQVSVHRAPLGFTSPTRHSYEIDIVRMGALPYRCVMPAGHPLAVREVVTLADLARRDFVAYSDSVPSGRMQDLHFAHMQQPPNIRARAENSAVIAALVLRGVGVGIIDPFSAHELVRRGGVSRPIDIDDLFRWSIIKPFGETLNTDLKAVVDVFEELTRDYA